MIAITGANGLLGSEITNHFARQKIECFAIKRVNSNLDLLSEQQSHIHFKDADILDGVSLTEALNGATTVIHTAALVSFNPRKAKQIYAVNVEGTKNVVDACLQLKIPHLIHISSVAALGREKGKPIVDEASEWVESPFNTDYAKSKYLAELEVFRGQEEGLKISIVNPSVILGRAGWHQSSSALFNYVWKEHKFFSAGTFNYVDVRDVVEAIDKLVAAKNAGRFIVNAGSVSSENLFKEIAYRFNKKAPSQVAGPFLISLATTFESFRSFLTKTEPLVTSQTAKIASDTFYFNNQKAINELNMKFRSLEETLDWCCAYYLANNSTNKH
jgi:nucleoside-diphosphate-sugar epimerase